MTSSGGNDVIDDAGAFTEDANPYLVHTEKISCRLDKSFKNYQRFSFRGAAVSYKSRCRNVFRSNVYISKVSKRKVLNDCHTIIYRAYNRTHQN